MEGGATPPLWRLQLLSCMRRRRGRKNKHKDPSASPQTSPRSKSGVCPPNKSPVGALEGARSRWSVTYSPWELWRLRESRLVVSTSRLSSPSHPPFSSQLHPSRAAFYPLRLLLCVCRRARGTPLTTPLCYLSSSRGSGSYAADPHQRRYRAGDNVQCFYPHDPPGCVFLDRARRCLPPARPTDLFVLSSPPGSLGALRHGYASQTRNAAYHPPLRGLRSPAPLGAVYSNNQEHSSRDL